MLELRVLGATDLRRTDGARVHSVLAQPKRFAVLVYLLLSARGAFARRDSLLALFWPESDDSHARAALRKAIHYLRASLGAEVVIGRGNDEIAVDTGRCECDALRLRSLLEAGRLEDAVAVYGGELLPGFHLDGAPGFDYWLETERSALRRLAAGAAVRLASDAHAAGENEAAAAWQRRAHEIAPDDADIAREALVLLIEAGQRSAALELLAAHRKRLAEAGIPDDANLDELFARQVPTEPMTADAGSPPRRSAAAASPLPTEPSARAPAKPGGADEARVSGAATIGGADVEPAAARPRRSVLRWLLPAAAGVAALLAVWLVPDSDRRAAADGAVPLIAVGAIRDFTADVDSVGRVIPDLLATNLARAPRLRVVSAARLHEIVGAAGDDVRRPSAVAAAARAAHAHELVEGALYRLPDGRLRLDLRRLRLADGELLDTYRVTGSNPFELVDRATATLALDIGGVGARSLRVADVTTRSLVALRFYQEGLDSYFSGDPETAAHLFDAALGEDSTFAMAAYFAGLANIRDWPVMHAYLQRAERLAHRTTDRERLLIRATLAFYRNEPEHLAIADSLVARYPDEPAAYVMYGRSLMLAGRFADAMVPFRRAVQLDSLSLARESGSCRACEALLSMGDAYLFLDSTKAAERTLRRAYDARASTAAFAAPLANALQANGKYAEADEYLRRAGALGMAAENVALRLIANDIRRGEFARADAALRGFIDKSARGLRSAGRWRLIISLRNQGRLDEALAVVDAERRDPRGSQAFPAMDVLTEAVIRFERGDYLRAGALFDSLAATVPRDGFDASWSRNVAWNLTHAANAYAAAGRLDLLEALADRVEAVGARSGYGRDPRLHHHIRGLLAAARNDHVTAVTEFRAALYSVAAGYTRTNVALARSLLALGRPVEAAAVLDPPLRNGGLDSMLFYTTLTELHALLGEALLAAGQRERARVHLDRALHGWRNADESFGERVAPLEALQERAG